MKISRSLFSISINFPENVTASYSDGQRNDVTYLRKMVSCLLAARAHVVLLAACWWMLAVGALLQDEDTSMLKHLCSLFIARGSPVNSLYGATAGDITGS